MKKQNFNRLIACFLLIGFGLKPIFAQHQDSETHPPSIKRPQNSSPNDDMMQRMMKMQQQMMQQMQNFGFQDFGFGNDSLMRGGMGFNVDSMTQQGSQSFGFYNDGSGWKSLGDNGMQTDTTIQNENGSMRFRFFSDDMSDKNTPKNDENQENQGNRDPFLEMQRRMQAQIQRMEEQMNGQRGTTPPQRNAPESGRNEVPKKKKYNTIKM